MIKYTFCVKKSCFLVTQAPSTTPWSPSLSEGGSLAVVPEYSEGGSLAVVPEYSEGGSLAVVPEYSEGGLLAIVPEYSEGDLLAIVLENDRYPQEIQRFYALK